MDKLLYCFLIAVFLISSIKGNRYKNIRTKESIKSVKATNERWITQKLDHFDVTNGKIWQQRYFVNDELYNETKKVVFLEVGGEYEADESWMADGAWYRMHAQEFQPILFQLEHRFYGKSHPTRDLSTESMVYLTIEQVLADLAVFIQTINEQYKFSSDVKWIVFGASYAGALAPWLRLKYPHLVHGVVSSSGTLLAKKDYPEYMQIIQEVLNSSSNECATTVGDGFHELEVSLLTEDGQAKVNKLYKLCDGIENGVNNYLDMANFYGNIAYNLAYVVQYNNDNIESLVSVNLTVDSICANMRDQSIGSPMDRLAFVNNRMLEYNGATCMDYKYDKWIEGLRNTSWESDAVAGARQWNYQICSQTGSFQISSPEAAIFGNTFPKNVSIKQCEDMFGSAFNETNLDNAIRESNIFYGGLDIEVTNVVFVQGSEDPWKMLGLLKKSTKNAPFIYIQGGSHCSNIYNPRDTDIPQIKKAREEIQKLIASWLEV